jgi:hypothetical protein
MSAALSTSGLLPTHSWRCVVASCGQISLCLTAAFTASKPVGHDHLTWLHSGGICHTTAAHDNTEQVHTIAEATMQSGMIHLA